MAISPRNTSLGKVLMISYLFPPVGGIGIAGAQRALKFAKYLPYYNWQPVILTVKDAYYEPYLSLDTQLLHQIPSEVQIIRTPVFRGLSRTLHLRKSIQSNFFRATLTRSTLASATLLGRNIGRRSRFQGIKDAITDLFEIPDEEMGWLLPSISAGLLTMKRERINAIYATGRPWTSLVSGAVLRKLTGTKLILDFRDPWMTNPFRNRYSYVKNRAESWLEKFVIHAADVVIANTPELMREFQERFPHERMNKFVTLLNGYDPDDYNSDNLTKQEPEKTQFTITHTGFLYGKRDPKDFLEAVRLAVARQMVDATKLRIRFVGSIELPYDLSAYLDDSHLQDVVSLEGHVSHQQSLEYLCRADVLLLLQPGTKTQIPSKLFEYLGFKKPVLAVSPPDGATCRLIASNQLGHIAAPDNIESICNALHSLYLAWKQGSLEPRVNMDGSAKFDVRRSTATLANLLNSTINS